MKPKGTLLIIGGAEDTGDEKTQKRKSQINQEYVPFEILKEILAASKHTKIEIITTGSALHEEVQKKYTEAFHKIHHANTGFIPIQNRYEAHNKQFLERVAKTNVIFFTGGDQLRLSTILGGTPIIELIKNRYQNDADFLVAGTSAGAMAMSAVMISEGGKEEALFGGDLKICSGLGLLNDCIVDTHFIKRGRFSRLAHAVIINPGQLGIGLGEDTALIIKNGSHAECTGSGMVVIIDGKNIGQTNVLDVTDTEPVFVENFTVHMLVKGCRFCIKSRNLAVPVMDQRR